MEKICFFATDKRMKTQIENALINASGSADIPVQVELLNFNQLIEQGQQLVEDGAEVLVASGGTFQELSHAIKEIPVLRLYLTTTDIIFALNQTQKYEKIYLLLNKTVLFDINACDTATRKKLEIYYYQSRYDIQEIIAHISPVPDSVIVGSAVLSNLPSISIPTITIPPSDSTIQSIYQYANDVASFNKREQKQISLLTAILANVEEGIILFDSKGMISHVNEKARHFLKLSSIPQSILEIFPDIPGTRNLVKYFQEKLLNYPPHKLVANVSSFAFDKETNYILTLRDVTELQRLENNIRFKLTKTGLIARHTFGDIQTNNKSMAALIRTAKTISDYDAPILIQGESGTGKELFAQSIHNASPRRHGPFVAINCAALPPELLESELFGYVGGSFTGARKEGKAGLFELAHNGTIFLDEINSMSANIQSELLRILENKEVMRIGSDYVIPLDIRIISASNADILNEISSGKFRKDLFFRLNTLTLNLPSLDERKDDVVYLFKKFLEANNGHKLANDTLPIALKKALENHHWWGNIRELQSVALRYQIFGDRGDPTYQYLFDYSPEESDNPVVNKDNLSIDMKQLQNSVEQLIIDDLSRQGYTKAQIAKIFNVSRQTLFNKIHYKNNEKKGVVTK